MTDFLGAAAVLVMAFIVGFAIRRGSICMVEAARLLVVDGRPSRLISFASASAISALAILPLAWFALGPQVLYANHPVTMTLLASGAGFGLGAFINGGCAFGTLGRLSGGQLEYAATIAASLTGAMLAIPNRAMAPASPGWFAEPGITPGAVLVGAVLMIAVQLKRSSWRNLRAAVTRDKTILQPIVAMCIIGLLSGLLFAVAGSWTHLALLSHEGEVLSGQRSDSVELRTLLGAAALLSGAVFAAIRSGRFRLQWPTMRGLVLRITGGLLMGYSAAHIPGGNGALITYGVPSGAASAWAALAAMTVMLSLLFLPLRFLRRAK